MSYFQIQNGGVRPPRPFLSLPIFIKFECYFLQHPFCYVLKIVQKMSLCIKQHLSTDLKGRVFEQLDAILELQIKNLIISKLAVKFTLI
jgi:hypothetical protein